MAPTRRPSRRRTTRAGTRVTARNHGQNRSATARAVPAGMIPQPRRGRCAGRGPPQQSLRSCRYSGYAAPFSRMAQERAHIRDGRPTVRGSHHGAPLGDEESAQQGGSPRTCLRTVPDHSAQQAPSDALGDRSAPGRGGRRRRAGSRPPSARYGPCSRAGAVTPPAPHGHATAASTGARRSRASRREPSIPKAGGGKARRRFPPQGSIYFRYPTLPARHGAVRSAHGRPSAGSQADRYADGPPASAHGGGFGFRRRRRHAGRPWRVRSQRPSAPSRQPCALHSPLHSPPSGNARKGGRRRVTAPAAVRFSVFRWQRRPASAGRRLPVPISFGTLGPLGRQDHLRLCKHLRPSAWQAGYSGVAGWLHVKRRSDCAYGPPIGPRAPRRAPRSAADAAPPVRVCRHASASGTRP